MTLQPLRTKCEAGPAVTSKGDPRAGVNTVNAGSYVNQRLAHLLVSDSAVKNANGSWATLKAARQAFQ